MRNEGQGNLKINQIIKSRKLRIVLMIILLLVVGISIWVGIRANSVISFSIVDEIPETTYKENEKVMKAISLSYLTYGCEGSDNLTGKVSEILKKNEMGIVTENYGIVRTKQDDPQTALFDTAEFIRKYVGEFRFLSDSKDKGSGFYGVAFCDDEKKIIWIVYSGATYFEDYIACAGLVLVPGLSTQEKMALEFFETIMRCEEVKDQAYGVILTGHSLGGALATEVSCVSGCEAVTINGADGIAIDKMNAILKNQKEEYAISNYMTSPQNVELSFLNLVQHLMFLGSYKEVDYHIYTNNGYTTDTHNVFSFITFEDDKYENPCIPLEKE